MDLSCFVHPLPSSFTPSIQSRNGAPLCKRGRQHSSSTVSAVLGTRVTEPQIISQSQTYTVKVIQRDRCTLVDVDSDANLRRALLDDKVDLYSLGGKLRNCGGAGQCGTCIVAVEEGWENMNARSTKEEILLRGKPEHWRLACRAKVYGDVTVRTKPKK